MNFGTSLQKKFERKNNFVESNVDSSTYFVFSFSEKYSY